MLYTLHKSGSQGKRFSLISSISRHSIIPHHHHHQSAIDSGAARGRELCSFFPYPSLSPRGFLFLSLCCRLQPRFCLAFKLSCLFSLSNPPSSLPFFFSSLQVVLLLCKLRPQYTFSHTRKSQPPLLGMVALAIALPPPSVHEIRLECDMFVTRVNFDLRVAHCEPR